MRRLSSQRAALMAGCSHCAFASQERTYGWRASTWHHQVGPDLDCKYGVTRSATLSVPSSSDSWSSDSHSASTWRVEVNKDQSIWLHQMFVMCIICSRGKQVSQSVQWVFCIAVGTCYVIKISELLHKPFPGSHLSDDTKPLKHWLHNILRANRGQRETHTHLNSCNKLSQSIPTYWNPMSSSFFLPWMLKVPAIW